MLTSLLKQTEKWIDKFLFFLFWQISEDNFSTTSVYNSAIPSYTTTTDTTRVQNLFQDESFEPPLGSNPYPPSDEYNPEEYNPEEATDAWDQEHGWSNMESGTNTDTPESPPMFEKEGYRDPVEYHDNPIQTGVEDVDQRVLPSVGTEMGEYDLILFTLFHAICVQKNNGVFVFLKFFFINLHNCPPPLINSH